MKGSDYFKKLRASLPRIEAEITQTIIAVEAENHFAEGFRRGGFTDQAFQPWQPRKKAETPQRALLVKTGAMRAAATKGRVEGSQVRFVMPLEYMKVHNEGGRAGRGAGFQMPKRQYIGPSAALDNKIRQKVNAYLARKLGSI